MSENIDRIEELVLELQALRKQLNRVTAENACLKSHLHSTNLECASLRDSSQLLTESIGRLNQKIQHTEKKYTLRLRHLENKLRKNDIFKDNKRGSSKTRTEQLIIDEMASLRHTNSVLLGFVNHLSHTIGFDSAIASQLCEIADNSDDKVILTFIDGLKQGKKDDKITRN